MAKRRAHGEGTIFQLPNGRWQADISLGYKPDGKRNRKSLYGKTQKEVRQKLDAVKQQLSQGTFSSSKLTVSDYLEQWVKEKARQVKPRTEELYREQARRYIVPHIGGVQLTKLKPVQVQAMVSAVADDVSAATANKARKLLYGALKQAVRWQLISRNVCEAVDPLKEVSRAMLLWTTGEAVQFLDSVRVHRLYGAFHLFMATGLRRGEVLGLRWSDLRGDKLHIQRSLTVVGGKPTWTTPKTEKGVRFVVLSPDALEALEHHRKQQDAERALAGEAWAETGSIFTSEDGRPIPPGTFHKVWLRLQKSAGVPQVRLHDLRHLHVSLLVKQGMDPRTIADRVGHTDPAFTLRRYSHMFEEQRQAAAINLSELLQPKRVQNVAN